MDSSQSQAGATAAVVPATEGSKKLRDVIAVFDQLSDNKRNFLLCYIENASVLKSCEAIGITRIAYYKWMHKDPLFVEAFEAAKHMAVQTLEDEVVRRGKDGVVEDVWYKGMKVGEKIVYSDTLLMFYLNGNAPEKYRNRHEVVAPGDGLVLTVEALDDLVKD